MRKASKEGKPVRECILDELSSLYQSWSELFASLGDREQENLHVLLQASDAAQVRSNVALLLSLGDCGLCHVLRI